VGGRGQPAGTRDQPVSQQREATKRVDKKVLKKGGCNCLVPGRKKNQGGGHDTSASESSKNGCKNEAEAGKQERRFNLREWGGGQRKTVWGKETVIRLEKGKEAKITNEQQKHQRD